MKDINVLIKFNDEEFKYDGRDTTTLMEHLTMLSDKGYVIWGQGSHRIKKLAEKQVKDINNCIQHKGYIYVFFVTSKTLNKDRDVYVGRCRRVFVRGELNQANKQIEYIPKYYSKIIGSDEDSNVALFEIDEMVHMDISCLDQVVLKSDNKQKVMQVKNMNSLFYVNLEGDLDEILEKKFQVKEVAKKNIENGEEGYQLKVEGCEEINIEGVEDSKGTYVTGNSERFKREPKRARNAIANAKYKCEVDGAHKFFMSNKTGFNYVEAHHLIPIEYTEIFRGINIDVEENIISLCPVCHKKLHHGVLRDKLDMLKELYEERKEKLRKKGIDIAYEELMSFYL